MMKLTETSIFREEILYYVFKEDPRLKSYKPLVNLIILLIDQEYA